MFTSIARVYDLNNTLLSFGLHHRWKKITASYVPITTEGRALDVGAGTADLALLIEPRMGTNGRVIASDLNHAMLVEGLKKVTGRGLGQKITCLEANAEHLGFPNGTFHAVTTGFRMRNVGNLRQAVKEIHRIHNQVGGLCAWSFPDPSLVGCGHCTIGTRSGFFPGLERKWRMTRPASTNISLPPFGTSRTRSD